MQYPGTMGQGQTGTPGLLQMLAQKRAAQTGGNSKRDMYYSIIANSLGGLPFVGGLVGNQGLGQLFQSKQSGGLGILNK